jgi:hypothetical protein
MKGGDPAPAGDAPAQSAPPCRSDTTLAPALPGRRGTSLSMIDKPGLVVIQSRASAAARATVLAIASECCCHRGRRLADRAGGLGSAVAGAGRYRLQNGRYRGPRRVRRLSGSRRTGVGSSGPRRDACIAANGPLVRPLNRRLATTERVCSGHLRPHGNCGNLHHFRAAGRACRSPLHCNGSVGAHGGRAFSK